MYYIDDEPRKGTQNPINIQQIESLNLGTITIMNTSDVVFVWTYATDKEPISRDDIQQIIEESKERGISIGEGTFSQVKKTTFEGLEYAIRITNPKNLETRQSLANSNLETLRERAEYNRRSKSIPIPYVDIQSLLCVYRDIEDRKSSPQEYINRLNQARATEIEEKYQHLFLANADLIRLPQFFGFYFDGTTNTLYEVFEFIEGQTIQHFLTQPDLEQYSLSNTIDPSNLRAALIDQYQRLKRIIESIQIITPSNESVSLGDAAKDNIIISNIKFDENNKPIFTFTCLDLIPYEKRLSSSGNDKNHKNIL